MIQFDPKNNSTEGFEDIKEYGFITPEIKVEDYFFGGETKIGNEIIKPDGQWLDFIGAKEWQWKKFEKDGKSYMVETMGCTGFGTLNAVETLHKFLYNEEINLSDRCINIEANNSKNGNSPQNPAEALRKLGCCKEEELPFSEECLTWELFHSPKPLPQALKDLAKKFLDKYEFMHEWVDTKNKQSLMDSLKRSPLGISVKAWKMRNGLYYKEVGETDNHWCCLVGYELNKCWYVFDSYDSFIKKLEWDYDFGFAKRYYLKKKIMDEELATPNPEENNMQCFQQKGTPELYFKGAGDAKFHYVPEMKMANAIWTQEEIQKRIEMVISPEYTGDTYYRKENILVQIIKVISNFFTKLRGKE